MRKVAKANPQQDPQGPQPGPQQHPQQRRPWFLPPMWLVVIVLGLGIYGTGTLYKALTQGHLSDGLLGFALMMLSALILGTPLAMARYWRWKTKTKRVQVHTER